MTLRLQLLLLQALIVCVSTVATGVVAGTLQERVIRDNYQDRLQAVALSVARLPAITDAFQTDNPSAIIQPIAEVIREASDVTYVVVTDAEGIRFSHPEVDRIGERVSTDPSVPLSGEVYVGTQTGTLGTSWRVKVPIFDANEEVIGTVSVGILESQLTDDFLNQLGWLVLAMVASAILGVFGAAWVTAIIRRRIYRLEPGEIASLVGDRETMLHGLTEGVVTVDKHGSITLVNDAAEQLLARPAADLVGRPASEVLEGPLADILEQGEPDGQLVLAGERVLVARSTGASLDDHPVGATLLLRDHTELHTLLRRLDGAQSLTDGLRAQAHEFANTMHVVSGLIEVGLGDEAREFIARTTPGGALGLEGDVDMLGDLELTALLGVKAAQARELGIELEVVQNGVDDQSTLPAKLRSDLLTILGNLIDNAIEASRVGDRVRVTLAQERERVRAEVEDSGPGIPRHNRDRVFEAGVTTKNATDAPDAPRRGIGLALVRRVVERRGGTIEISASELGGARFSLTVPVGQGESTSAELDPELPVRHR